MGIYLEVRVCTIARLSRIVIRPGMIGMKRNTKAAIIAITSVVVGGAFLWIGVIYWIKDTAESGMEWISDGRNFGEAVTDTECIEHGLELDDKCHGFECRISNSVWLKGCLETSKRTEGTCDGVPPADSIFASAAWRISQCNRANRHSQTTASIYCVRKASLGLRQIYPSRYAGRFANSLLR